MRIACWNCGDGLLRKRAMLAAIDADVIVVSEVRLAAFEALLPEFAAGFYTGSASARGVATFLRVPGLALRPFAAPDGAECYQWLTGGGVDILAAWVKSKGDYVRPAHRTIARFLEQAQSLENGGPHRIVLGDLNANVMFDATRRARPTTAMFAALADAGLRSLYHEHTGEALGAETRATHHFTYSAARPFHLDYIFASAGLALEAFHLGAAADWIGKGRGDHVPLVAHLKRR